MFSSTLISYLGLTKDNNYKRQNFLEILKSFNEEDKTKCKTSIEKIDRPFDDFPFLIDPKEAAKLETEFFDIFNSLTPIDESQNLDHDLFTNHLKKEEIEKLKAWKNKIIEIAFADLLNEHYLIKEEIVAELDWSKKHSADRIVATFISNACQNIIYSRPDVHRNQPQLSSIVVNHSVINEHLDEIISRLKIKEDDLKITDFVIVNEEKEMKSEDTEIHHCEDNDTNKADKNKSSYWTVAGLTLLGAGITTAAALLYGTKSKEEQVENKKPNPPPPGFGVETLITDAFRAKKR